MTLSSYIKGPNNIIHRKWDRKAEPWSLEGGLVMVFMQAHTKVGSDYIAKPYIDVVWKVWLLGLNLKSIAFSPFFPFFVGSFHPPLLSQLSFPFILVFPSHSSPTSQFFLFWGRYSSFQSIRQSGWGWLGKVE